MKALVYHGPGKRDWEDKARPDIQDPSDAIVRITTSTICGTDLFGSVVWLLLQGLRIPLPMAMLRRLPALLRSRVHIFEDSQSAR